MPRTMWLAFTMPISLRVFVDNADRHPDALRVRLWACDRARSAGPEQRYQEGVAERALFELDAGASKRVESDADVAEC